ncbi:MAG: hypothetical protein MJZ03_02975, partial [archaeon]|nr:hypothetical protein [archaeon]
AEITVISQEVLPELRKIAHSVTIGTIPDDVRQIIDRYDVVIAATDEKSLNDSIRDAALYMGISVNSAHGGGNILIPSVLEKKGYSVAVSSGGKAPVFPPYMIKHLDNVLGPEYDRMLDLMIDIREISKKKIAGIHERRKFLESVIYDENIQKLIFDGKIDDAKTAALKIGGFL